MSDIEVLQAIILLAAVALMAFVTYNGLKLRAYQRSLERDSVARETVE